MIFLFAIHLSCTESQAFRRESYQAQGVAKIR
jgi:hypothetical protein